MMVKARVLAMDIDKRHIQNVWERKPVVLVDGLDFNKERSSTKDDSRLLACLPSWWCCA